MLQKTKYYKMSEADGESPSPFLLMKKYYPRGYEEARVRGGARLDTYFKFINVLIGLNPFDGSGSKSMRSRIFRLLVSPIAVIFWIIGWTMLWAGANREKEVNQTRLSSTERETFVLRPAVLEQPKIEA